MEPGHEDREYQPPKGGCHHVLPASMEPGHEDREYIDRGEKVAGAVGASMEPGHEDREYAAARPARAPRVKPQWSPVMKTGNTRGDRRRRRRPAGLNGARS